MYGDHVKSDDMGEILEMSRLEHERSSSGAKAGPSRSKSAQTGNQVPSHLQRHTLNEKIAELDAEIKGYDEEINDIKRLRALRIQDREALLEQLQQTRGFGAQIATAQDRGRDQRAHGGIDYTAPGFDWSQGMKAKMKKVFGIDQFRLCQEGVCNANMDGRDIVCVMPTGGGKSLTYQLPALLTPGCTLVISPLIALITDQILHLREAGVEAVMLTGGTSKEETRDAYSRMTETGGRAQDQIKLCYVTPEKISKSQAFKAVLGKVAAAGNLARIVIDEAHCVSQLGHDFRPDYQKLHVLRQLFPRVPIMALSATCPPKVLQDLINTLRLKGIIDGKDAKPEGTVYFSAPLYRKNLHYRVLPKPSSSTGAIKAMTDYILQNHPNDTGIVYCLSKKDSETVAEGLSSTSNGKIKTGVYHADIKEQAKEHLHKQWRKGAIKVVCATIAFGLGIDKGDVRFVLHHSMSKSMDGFYQESGRAGRDGKDADCVLYYRPQDATRLSGIMCSEKDGQLKLYDMLRFAQNMQECRKVHFAKYFSASSQLSVHSWTTDDSGALDNCGHCDNCTRAPDAFDHKDVTVEAWQILKVADAANRIGGRLTLNKLADLVRGNGGGALEVQEGGRRKGKAKAKEKVDIDIEQIVGGKVGLSKDATETVLIDLLTSNYLGESYHNTAYATNVYVIPGPQAIRLTRLSRKDVENGNGPRIMSFFRKTIRKKAKEVKASGSGETKRKKKTEVSIDLGKRKSRDTDGSDEEEEDEEEGLDGFIVPDDEVINLSKGPKRSGSFETIVDSDSDDLADQDWAYTLRSTKPPPKKPRTVSTAKGLGKSKLDFLDRITHSNTGNDDDIIDLASDSD